MVRVWKVLVCVGLEAKCGETDKSTVVSASEKPLEEAPQEAEGEKLSKHSHLLPVTHIMQQNHKLYKIFDSRKKLLLSIDVFNLWT